MHDKRISPTCEANIGHDERLQLRQVVADPLRRCVPELLVHVDIQHFQRGKLRQRWWQLCKQTGDRVSMAYMMCIT